MAMDKINGSPMPRSGMLDRLKVGNQGSGGESKTQSASKSDSPTGLPGDRAEISDTAHQLMDLRATMEVGRAALASTPDVREERVAEAKKRLEQGFYNSTVVQDKVAAALQKIFSGLE